MKPLVALKSRWYWIDLGRPSGAIALYPAFAVGLFGSKFRPDSLAEVRSVAFSRAENNGRRNVVVRFSQNLAIKSTRQPVYPNTPSPGQSHHFAPMETPRT